MTLSSNATLQLCIPFLFRNKNRNTKAASPVRSWCDSKPALGMPPSRCPPLSAQGGETRPAPTNSRRASSPSTETSGDPQNHGRVCLLCS